MPLRIPLTNWEQLHEEFLSFFEGLGETNATSNALTFNSVPPHVVTGFSISSNGEVNAAMPLHQISIPFSSFEFDHHKNMVHCVAEGRSYNYTVPSEILNRRGGGS
ncbi:MAG: hypothetical protein QF699_02605 [Candidatus Poseidoniaceae archaeon]|nr:hypothetical protein [Candidatus Poseidoniaceae archaeon]